MEQQAATQRPAAPMPQANPIAERDKLRRLINRHVRRLAMHVYNRDFQKAWHEEVERYYHTKFKVILHTWTLDNLRPVADRLERRILEVFRRG
jgi:hypothetical protein